MANIFGIEFAPIKVPIHRRLQTLVVFQFISMFLFYGLLSVAFLYYVFFYTRFWWIVVLYLIWYVIDQPKAHRGGRHNLLILGEYVSFFAVRKWRIWRHFRDYFPIQLIKTHDLNPHKNYIFGYHPHGMISIGAVCSFVMDAAGFSEIFPGLVPHLLTLRCWFYFPIVREILLFGGLSAASRENIDSLLHSTDEKSSYGKCVVIVIGGAQEALYANPGSHTLVLSSRFGFVKKAIIHGAALVPVYGFGENDLFWHKQAPRGSMLSKFQHFFRKIFTFSTPLFWGRGIFNYTFGILPRRIPLNVVVGPPIEPKKKNPNPTSEEIQQLHGRYVEALTNLFESNKKVYGITDDVHLEIL